MQPGFPLAQLKTFVDQEFAQIKHVLHGISLLGQCPDGVNASLICRGEKLSIAIMAALLEARGHKVSVINPVEKLLAVGHYLESTVDITESTRRIAASQIPADHMVLIPVLPPAMKRVNWLCWGVMALTIPQPCWPPVCVPTAAKSGPTSMAFIPAIRVRCRMRAC